MRKLILSLLWIFLIFPINVRAADEPPWQRFIKNGVYTEDIVLYGRSNQCADIVIEITKSGGDKEGEYRYSSDNGRNWSDIKVIKCTSDIALFSTKPPVSDLGVKVRFLSGAGFEKGERYEIHAPITYDTQEGINVGEGKVRVSSEDIIYNDSYKIFIKITRSGALGEGEFSYSEDGKKYSEDITIPKSGAVSMYDGKVTVTFWCGSGRFLVGDEYRCEIKGDMSKRNYTPYILAIAGAAFFVMYLVYSHLSSMKDKLDNYVLYEYTRVEGKKNRALSKRRQY